jgi:transglutaminase-like putative cysteine protease
VNGASIRRAPAVAPDIVLLAVSLSAGLGTARLTQAPGAGHVVGPVIATVVAGHLAASAARRLRVSVGFAMVAGAVAVALTTIWGQLYSATRDGVPTLGTWRALLARFDTAGAVIRSHPTPVPATPEVVLCIATGAGLVAVLGRSLWARQEARGASPLPALVPTFGLFCYTALLSSQVDRVPAVTAYFVCALAFLIVADRATGSARAPGNARPPRSVPRRLAAGATAAAPAVLGAALAVIVPLVASPVLGSLRVDALPFGPADGNRADQFTGIGAGSTGAGPGGPSGAVGPSFTGVRAIDLVDNLQAVLVNRTTELMFSAVTTLPTYWQVAVLSRFNGTAWIADPTTEAAAEAVALPPPTKPVTDLPALPEPALTSTFRADVTIGALQSTLLPLPPTTVSITADADVVPGFGAVQAIEASPGLTYSALARVPVNPSKAAPGGPPHSPGTTGATPSSGGVDAASLAPYLQLPTEPAQVVALAHQIVAGVSGPAAQAAALTRWFDTGRYRYTLSPPPTSGPNALASFLFNTRAGFCQQFAAAFAVLARIDGLPTRVAVGFTSGSAHGHNRYRITGADAHVWPEVYLGPAAGWTSYEPTPASSGEQTGVGVNSGRRSVGPSSGNRSTATTATTVATLRRPLLPAVSPASTIPLKLHGTTAGGAGRGWSAPVVVLAVVAASVVALVVVAGAWVLGRGRARRDPRRPRGARTIRRRRIQVSDPTAEVLAQWRTAEWALERARLGRRPTETLQEHTGRLRSLAGAMWLVPHGPVTEPASGHDPTEATIDAYARLASLAARASYGSDPCTDQEAVEAARLEAVVRAGLPPAGARRGVLVPH